jgi:hypothetical protein
MYNRVYIIFDDFERCPTKTKHIYTLGLRIDKKDVTR